MTYTPLEGELKELGFRDEDVWHCPIFYRDGTTEKTSIILDGDTWYLDKGASYSEFFPQNRQDIETVIRLFTTR